MIDPAHEWTDERIEQLERKIREVYKQAQEEVSAKLDDYLRRFRIKDETKRDQVKRGVITEQEYKNWRTGQIIVGKRWESLRDELALHYHNANLEVKRLSRIAQGDIFVENINYSTYEIEMQAQMDTSFILWNAEAVERILLEDPEMLPPPGKKVSAQIAKNKDVRWNNQQIQAVMIQGILQGESISKLAKRLEQVTDKNHKAAIRNARTMATGAENAGRIASYKRAKEMGVNLENEWRAVLDMRTRHEHRLLDGVIMPVDEPWEVDGYKLRFPGDPQAPGHLIYNCRCAVRPLVDGLEPLARKTRSTAAIGDLTYEEWKRQKTSKSNRITLPEEKAEAIRKSYIREYMR